MHTNKTIQEIDSSLNSITNVIQDLRGRMNCLDWALTKALPEPDRTESAAGQLASNCCVAEEQSERVEQLLKTILSAFRSGLAEYIYRAGDPTLARTWTVNGRVVFTPSSESATYEEPPCSR